MHRFGGIYADLDLVPLRRLSEQLPFLGHKTSGPVSMAYVGHMGNDDFEHSIPNAFMASSAPYHPFWMEPLEYVRAHRSDEAYNTQPEGLTGPVALCSRYTHSAGLILHKLIRWVFTLVAYRTF